MKNSRKTKTPLEKFWSHVEKNANGCWVWIGAIGNGYGYFKPEREKRTFFSHRWAYEHFKGPIPKGLQIDHLCRNKACANPEHLEAVTGTENVRRAQKFRVYKKLTHCRKGHEFTEVNIVKVGKSRTCRICRNARIRNYYYLKKGVELI